ncbi:MAG: phenylalanine--tRNA ligase subunit alpha [Gammaproteobacteria bacterium]|nr:phenylalanine--tRNA ligase subunit alpha [Gammaproteobacteria bacterium]
MQPLESIIEQAQNAVVHAANAAELQAVRVQYLGKKGQLTHFLKSVVDVDPKHRPQMGQAVNQAKQTLQATIQAKDADFKRIALDNKLKSETIDVTLPGRGHARGSLHPVTQIRQRIERFFTSIGFQIAEGPEVENDYHNFTALNIPEHHPARADFDTFYFGDGRLLRTHTSPVQIRFMEQHPQLPLRIIAPGRVYRCDSDATHSPMFNQIEGLLIDENISFAHLKGILQDFLDHFFDTNVEMRLRPSYFPFTEPSAEVDILRRKADGSDDWLEILGCGMVHPTVLKNVGIDSEKYTGFAFGIGMDRLAMLRYGINDLRVLFDNDIRFLEQF